MKKTRKIMTAICIFALTIGSSITVFAEEAVTTDIVDTGTALNFVTDLIGTTETFTPQNVMSIFVICLVLECISHIASSIMNATGGLK